MDQKGEGETKIVAQSVRPFTPDPLDEEDRLLLRVDSARLGQSHVSRLRELIQGHAGGAAFVIEMATPEGAVRLRFGERYRVDARDSTLIASLKGMFGERCLA